ncbi:MAG: hypothetical protein Q7T18_09310 [Sedimentisphaerales bacterium]|nr:hypothetical protein [Sedimentisphaerales bacterium]
MKQKAKKIGGNQVMKNLMAEKKKIIIASLLIGVMAVMWGRIFFKKDGVPAAATAMAIQAAAVEETPSQPKVKMTYVELPQVKGRNDTLARDVFAAGGWQGLVAVANNAPQSTHRVKSSHEQLSDRVNEMIGKELRLDAILSGKNPQAYVGGTLVSPGGKLIVKQEGENYEFRVVAIRENEVVLVCKGVQVKLIMTRPSDLAD